MSRIKRGRPSPAILVAVIALVAALGGTALAGPGPTANTAGKADTALKKAKKAIKKAKAAQSDADSAQASADSAQSTANTANGKADANATELATSVIDVERVTFTKTGTGSLLAFADCPAGKTAIGSTARIRNDDTIKEYVLTNVSLAADPESQRGFAESTDLATGEDDEYDLDVTVICADQ